ncbi:hypothetical protein [Paenibacillus sp. UNC496MF]|uniref:hypothetical protein n=1 Tax=Paenibacillus sp. UNC496MF TaxID=1502753 RepID=UPI002108E471|nr:hypothetical protein [Paenibacillus sp. UNC496MF]
MDKSLPKHFCDDFIIANPVFMSVNLRRNDDFIGGSNPEKEKLLHAGFHSIPISDRQTAIQRVMLEHENFFL